MIMDMASDTCQLSDDVSTSPRIKHAAREPMVQLVFLPTQEAAVKTDRLDTLFSSNLEVFESLKTASMDHLSLSNVEDFESTNGELLDPIYASNLEVFDSTECEPLKQLFSANLEDVFESRKCEPLEPLSSSILEVAAFEDVQEDNFALTGDNNSTSDIDLGWLTSSDTSDAESEDGQAEEEDEEYRKAMLDVFESLHALSDALPQRKMGKRTVQRLPTAGKQQLPQDTIQSAYEYIQYLKSEIELHIKGSVVEYREGLQYKHKFSIKALTQKSDKKEIKRPKNGFIRFSMEQRRHVAQQYPSMDNREISRILGIKWRKLQESTKRKYEQEFEAEMAEVKRQHPGWRYAGMRGQNLPGLVEPIPSRLRPREKLKRKFVARNLVRRPYRRKAAPHKTAATQWVQCDKCSKWRKLPPHVHTNNLPDMWFCELNEGPDNMCIIPQESDDED